MKNNVFDIGFDFDGVMADIIRLKHQMAKKLYGVEGIRDERFKEGMVLEDGFMDHDQYRRLMNLVCGDMQVGLKMEAVDGLEKYLPIFEKSGHQIVVITSREGPELDVARKWCEDRGFDLDYISVGYGNGKQEVACGLKVYVDDDLSKLYPLVGQVPWLYLFTQPHNKHNETPKGIMRVSSWKELYDNIQQVILI